MFFIAPAIFRTPADHVTFSKIFFKKNIYKNSYNFACIKPKLLKIYMQVVSDLLNNFT